MITKRKALALVRDRMGDCHRCILWKSRKNLVFGAGDPDAPLMFLGEAPGKEEDEQGVPFVGKAGQLLTEIIAAMGWSRDTVYIANVLKSRPPENRYPTPREVSACFPFALEQIRTIKPAVLVTLGNLATKTLLGIETGIMSIRGKWQMFEGIPVMPTFHPSFLLRQPSGKRYVWKDVQEIVTKLSSLGFPPPFSYASRRLARGRLMKEIS